MSQQQRIDKVFGGGTSHLSADAIATQHVVDSICTSQIASELAYAEQCEQTGKAYVKNGSRDRWGNLRANQGGRPPKKKVEDVAQVEEVAQVGGKPKGKSRRKRPGCRGKREFGARERIAMIKRMKELQLAVRKKHPGKSQRHLKILENRAIRSEFPHLKRAKDITKFMATEKRSKEIVVKNALGKDLTSPGRRSRGAQACMVRKNGGHTVAMGFRASGGGRKNKFQHIWRRVKAWHSIERLKGLQTDLQDISTNLFDQMQMEVDVLQYVENRGCLPAESKAWKAEVLERIDKLQKSPAYLDVHLTRLMSWAGMSLGRPQRRSNMTLDQEKLGWKVTMQSWDHICHVAAHGTAEDLRGLVGVPEEFIKQRENIVAVFEDQVPTWLARQLKQRLTVFASHEKVKDSKQSKKAKKGQPEYVTRISDQQQSQSQKLPKPLEKLAEAAAAQGMSQTRSGAQGADEDDKLRVTLQLRHAVHGLFGKDLKKKPPAYQELPPVFVGYGKHCRISNIVGPPGDRRWKNTEEFWVGGRKVVHRAGTKVKGGMMEPWLLLRDEFPEVFKEIVIMQQPSATVDEIITAWNLEDLASRFPAIVLQRDLQSGALSCRARMAACLLHVLCCWIAPGMTPVTQLTDTDFAKKFKEFLAYFKVEVARELKEQCLAEGRKFSMKYHPRQILFILVRACRALRQYAQDLDLGLQGLRRNGQLMAVPQDGKIVELTEEHFPWIADLAAPGGHRYPSEWLQERMSHVVEGIPAPPNWQHVLDAHERQEVIQQQGEEDPVDFTEGELEAQLLEKLGELQYDCKGEEFAMSHRTRICGQFVDVPVMVIHVPEGTQDLISDVHLKELQKTPAQRRAEKHALDLENARKGRPKTKIRRAIGRGVRMKLALGKFSEDVLKQIEVNLMKFTRHEVYQQLQFLAGPKVKEYVDATKAKGVKKHTLKGMSWKDLKRKAKKSQIFLSKEDILVDRAGKASPKKTEDTGVAAASPKKTEDTGTAAASSGSQPNVRPTPRFFLPGVPRFFILLGFF